MLTNGKLEVFVFNESNANVWFDDMQIQHIPTLISQENHYYAFGMNAKEIEKEGSNRFQFMGVEKESSFGLDWTETDHRTYDAEVGRFWQVDKLSEEAKNWTSYRFGFNNPISHTDPTGLWEETATGWKTSDASEIKAFHSQLVSGAKKSEEGGSCPQGCKGACTHSRQDNLKQNNSKIETSKPNHGTIKERKNTWGDW